MSSAIDGDVNSLFPQTVARSSMPRQSFWYDRDLDHALTTLELTDYDYTEDEEGFSELELLFDVDPIHIHRLIEERTTYLAAATGEEPSMDAVMTTLTSELATALDVQFNTVGVDSAPAGAYRRLNDRQWEVCEDETLYGEYSDLLYELTGRDINYDEHTPSVPGLYEPFLEAIVNSDDHDLPPPGAIRPIITEHLNQLRQTNQSTAAVTALKHELEAEGVNPRSAYRIADRMEELLISDAELERATENNE